MAPTLHARKTLRGLHRTGLPFKIAQLAVGEFLVVDCPTDRVKAMFNRVALTRNTKAMEFMRFECREFHCMDVRDPDIKMTVVKITRMKDEEAAP